jgi:histidine triad (HIT) family protein
VFCDLTQFREAEVCLENDYCLYASTRDPRDPVDVLPGCGVIIPIAHRLSPFDFTPEEWAATHELLLLAKGAQDARLSPDGYALIWNCYSEVGQSPLHCTCTSSRASTTSRSQARVAARRSSRPRTAGPILPRAGADGHRHSGRRRADSFAR